MASRTVRMTAVTAVIAVIAVARVGPVIMFVTVLGLMTMLVIVVIVIGVALHNSLSVCADQHFNVLTDTARQCIERVTAFERRHDAAFRIMIGDGNQLLRQPAIVCLHPTERG